MVQKCRQEVNTADVSVPGMGHGFTQIFTDKEAPILLLVALVGPNAVNLTDNE